MDTETSLIIPPHSQESEALVLGCMLTNTNSLKIAADALSEDDFFFEQNKIIFRTLQKAHKEDAPSDVHLVSEELKRENKLQKAGGVVYITSLAQYAGTSCYVDEYVAMVKQFSTKRRLLCLSKRIESRISQGYPSEIITEIHDEIRRIERSVGITDKFPIKFLSQFSKNFLSEEPPQKSMLLEYAENEKSGPTGFLPKGIVAMLVGAGGVGKTHLLAQLAISMSTGTPWLGTFTTTNHCGEKKKGNVFFGVGENQYDDIQRVLYKASKPLRENQPDLFKEDPLKDALEKIAVFSFCGQQAAFIENKKPSLYFRQFKMKLIDMAPKDGWAIIILDPISRLLGADAETDNAAATQFIALLEELTIDLPGNPTVLIAHHMSKSAIKNAKNNETDQTAARGSSALTDGVRLQLNLIKKNDDELTLSMQKSNFTKILKDISLKKCPDGFLDGNQAPIKKLGDLL